MVLALSNTPPHPGWMGERERELYWSIAEEGEADPHLSFTNTGKKPVSSSEMCFLRLVHSFFLKQKHSLFFKVQQFKAIATVK